MGKPQMMDEQKKGKTGEDNGPVSLAPLKLNEALFGLLAVKPPPESRSEKRKPTKGRHPQKGGKK